ncbi:MAG: hypothetical protein V7749_17890 [Cocleimonas sp.]
MKRLLPLFKAVFPDHSSVQNSHEKNNDGIDPYPSNLEFILGALFLVVIGFLGSQKIIHVVSDSSSAVNIYSLSDSACSSGLRLPFIECSKPIQNLESVKEVSELSKPTENISEELVVEIEKKEIIPNKYPLIHDMDQSDTALPLRKQFAHLPNLATALNKLKWNDGSEEDAVRLLTIASTLVYGRQREAHLEQSAMARLLSPVWNSYPDLVAASHCLYCGQFFSNVLKPFMTEGTENKDHLNALATAHPRFLNAIYQSGQIEIDKINDIAKLQAELSSSGDAATAKFIGEILFKNKNIDLLHHWSSKGWNGSYAISEYNKLIQLPQNLIIDAWQRGVSRGTDNAVLTRYLISTGYRPALRWLLWFHSGNLSYFKNRQHQHAKDRYNDFLTAEYIEFPKDSYSDLTGFYSKNWKDIHWNESRKKWIFKKKS